MKLDFCAVCGTTKDLHQHHIEPVVFTGIKRVKKKKYNPHKSLGNCDAFECFARIFDIGYISEDEEITLCNYHHNIMHGVVKFHKVEQSMLIKEGLRQAKQKGIKLGRPTKLNDEVKKKIIEMKSQGVGMKKISSFCHVGRATIYRVLNGVV